MSISPRLVRLALSLVIVIGLFLPAAPPHATLAAPIAGSLRIETITAYNLIVDSNVESPSTYAPSAATFGAKFCNDGATDLTDVFAYIGDYNPDGDSNTNDSTPGIYPARAQAPLVGPLPGGKFALTHEGGSAGLADATRYIDTIPAGECRTQYWLVSYPRLDTLGKSVTQTIKADDDLWLQHDIWATANESGTARTSDVTTRVTMRNEISAAANKIWPNGDNKVPDQYLQAIAAAFGWGTLVPGGGNIAYPGQTVTTQGIWYDLGNIGAGFDNDGNLVPDHNAWLQPIGDPDIYDPGCFRLVRSYGIVIVKLVGGGEQLIPFVDQLYFENIPDNTGAVGLAFYEYAALDGACTAGVSPYQEVASGFDNEKFNGDYGIGIPALQSRQPLVTLAKGVDKASITLPQSLIYTIPFTNTGVPNIDPVFGLSSYNMPLVLRDSIPAGTVYIAGSATSANVLPSGVTSSYKVLYSHDGGATWSATEAPATTVTHIQWWLGSDLPAGSNGRVSFQVSVPGAYTQPVVPNEAEASLGNGPPFANANVTTIVQGVNSLSGNVFRDNGATGQLGNGIYDTLAETLLPNVTVILYYDTNGDGKGDIEIARTAASYTGAYSFPNLADGKYVVTVDTADGDIPSGWANTTRTIRTAALDPTSISAVAVNVSGINFGFAPALTLDKRLIGSSPVYEGDLVTFGIDVANTLPGSGTAGATNCTYVIPASIIQPDNSTVPGGGGPANSQWSSTNNAAGLPDGNFALTNLGNNPDKIGLSGFNLGDQGGAITSVQYRLTIRERVDFRTGDSMAVRIYNNDLQLGSDLTYQGNVAPFTGGGTGSVYTFNADITGLRAWNWTDFSANLTEMQIEGNAAGGSPNGELDLDAAAFVVTTSQTCGGDDTIMSTVPLTDTFDTSRFQFVSATPNIDSNTPANQLTWNNVGPLYPGQVKTVQVTYRVLTPAAQGQSTTNYAGITGARYANGRSANTAFDNVPLTINYTGSIAGRVFRDANTNGWQGAIGDDAGDTGIPAVTVEIFGCIDSVTGALYTTATASTSQDCAGQTNGAWQLIGTQVTDSSGYYTFDALRDGFYVVEVVDGSAVLTTLTSSTLPIGTQTAEASASQVVNAGFTCPSCSGLWGTTTGTSGRLNTTNFNPINTINEVIGNVDFGYDTQAVLYGKVWEDNNGDGSIGSGEGDLASVTVYLCDNADTPPCTAAKANATTATDTNGNYHFGGLTAGDYFIGTNIASLPGGVTWINTADPGVGANDSTSDNITIIAGEISGSHDFGYQRSGSFAIGDTLYYDWDGDGAQDAGVDEGIRDVTVLLYEDEDGDGVIDAGVDALIATQVTTINGVYTFTNLPNGNYIVMVDSADPQFPASYTETQDPDQAGICSACDSRSTETIAGANIITTDFGYKPTGVSDIGDTVWYDRNGDRLQSGDQEVGLPNISVSLQVDFNGDGSFVTVRTASTDASGNYLFTNLPNGNYRVVVNTADLDIPNDAFGNPFTPTTLTAVSLTLSGADVLTADFGFTALGAIGDTIFWDANGDGEQDWNEAGIDGVSVTLRNTTVMTDSNGTAYPIGSYTQTTTTASGSGADPAGYYWFSALPPGRYAVTVTQATGPIGGAAQTADPDRDGETCLSATYPGLPTCDNATAVGVLPGSSFMGADFGYQPPGTIGDTLWIDANSNSVRDAGESGIPNITVTLSGACGGSCPSTTTDVDGYYSFTNLLDGSYTVTVDQADLDFPAGLTQTYDPDSSVDNQTTVVIAGGVVTSIGGSACSNCSLNADFGYRFDGVSSLSGTICLDDATPNGVCGSGISDVSAGELAFANVTVYLYRWIDTGDNIPQPGEVVLVGSTPSGGTGDYSFTQLAVGAYLVSIGSPLENTQLTTVTGNTPATAVVKAPGSGATTSAYQSVVLPGSAVNGLDFAFKSLVNYDFGDLPASYSTTLESNPDGARHVVLGTPTLYLGTRPDSESNGQPSALADGDGADEDGVTLVNPNAWTNGLASAKGGKVQVNVTGSGWLVGWLDFNGDGDFTDSSEMIISQPVSTGTAIYPFNIPNGTLTGTGKVVNGRFRLFDQQPAFPIFAYAGTASSGEVEDYRFLLSTGIVDGTIYSDTNTDGVYTLGIDVPLPSVIVEVTDSLGGVYTLTTDSNGYFSQTVPAGSTVVDVRDSTLPAGSTLTPGNTDPTTLIVPVGETATDNTGYVAPAAPDLRIVKTDGGVSTIPGGTVAYTLSYTNTGNVGATRVVITETVPANTSFSVSGSTAGWNCTLNGIAGSTCTWSVGSLASGASGSITFEVTVVNPVPAGVTQVANTAVIADDGTNGNDPTPANNTSSDVTPITAVPILKAQKSVVNLEGHVTVAGDRLEYTIVIQNTGNTAATGTALMDAIPANTTYLPGSTKLNGASIADLGSTMPYASGGQVDSPGEPSGQINAGESATIVFRVKIDDPLPAGVTQISNQGIVSATGIASLSTNNPSTLAPDDPTTLSISKPTAIALANFTATWQDNAVDLRWETTAELNTWGFQLYRSTDGKRASAVRVTPVLILGQGRGQGGASYIWIDTTAQVGVTYVYWLVETELNGTTNEYGPTRALPRTESSASRVLLPMMLR